MDRRTFMGTSVAAAASSFLMGPAHAQPAPKAKNVVLVHGLFADGSSWSEVIPRLQAVGLNVTSVQNPLTTLPEAVASAVRVLHRQDGPTVLAGHSFSGMIVTDAGVHPNVSAVVYVAARAGCRRRLYGLGQEVSNAACVGRHRVRRRRRTPQRAGFPAGFRRRSAGREGKGALRGSMAVPEGPAHRPNHARGLAVEAKLVRGVHGGSDDQPRSPALHGQAHGRQHHRGHGEPRFVDLAA